MKTELMTSRDDWTVLKEQATALVRSGFLPKGIDTPEKAVAIALKGREMGLPLMQSFSHISIINGKPCVSSELMLAQIYRLCPGARINIEQTTDTGCIINAARPAGKTTRFEFCQADAKRAGLLAKDTWQKFPKAMYHARCVSLMARAMFPDAIMGASYTPEEMGAEVNEENEIIKIASNLLAESVSSAPEELYTATLPQMQEFAKICSRHGITDKGKMSELSKKLTGAPIHHLTDLLREVMDKSDQQVILEDDRGISDIEDNLPEAKLA